MTKAITMPAEAQGSAPWDSQHPNWDNIQGLGNWKRYVSEEVRRLWQTFTPEQREALARQGRAHALEIERD